MDVNGPVGRVVQRAAASPRFAPIASKIMPRLDTALSRLTRGHLQLSRLLVPTLVLTATGAKSGQPRTTPLATLPEDDGSFLVVGSNFGRDSHPGWTANLLKTPRATVTFRGATFPVAAHLLSEQEKGQAWPRLTAVWPVYDRYVETSGRELRVFRLVRTE